MNKTRGRELRELIRKKLWPGDDAWTGENEKGFFQSPRTLPLIMLLISMKRIGTKGNAARVYLELWSRHMGGGVIEMKHEGEHAYAAGYVGNRAMRTWRDHMVLLEKNGFIKIKGSGNQRFKYVLLLHPTAVVEKLRLENKVDPHWLGTYELRQIETKEPTYAARMRAKRNSGSQAPKLIAIKIAKPADKKKATA
ncbi:MAG TPA: hypothetical protein VLV89_08790 [Candidatus Acidoferrum sp.]|nr:hypothetical protein [Candidatus Acidoferrum sp.]